MLLLLILNSNIYKLAQFQYSINEELLKGEKIFAIEEMKKKKKR